MLDCVLNEKSCVCEKHFNENDIKSEKIIAKDAKIIFEMSFFKYVTQINLQKLLTDFQFMYAWF